MAFTGIKAILKEFRRRILAERTAQTLPDVTDGGWRTYARTAFPLGGYICIAARRTTRRRTRRRRTTR